MPSRTARLSKKGCGFATPECRAQRDVAVHPRPAPPPPLLAAPRPSTTALGDLEIRWVVSQSCFRRGAPQRATCDTFDEAHGRLVRRRVFASTKAARLEALSAWPGLHTVLAVESRRSTSGAPKVETRAFKIVGC